MLNHPRTAHPGPTLLALAALLFAPPSSMASDIAVAAASASVVNDILVLDADASFEFSDDAIDALQSGIEIIIDVDVRIKHPRKYLWDTELLSVHRQYSIQRHALSKQFMLVDLITGDRRLHGSLELALEDLGRIRAMPLAEVREIGIAPPWQLSLRLRLDIDSLPAPLIPIAYISPGWHMSSGWYRWTAHL